MKVERRENTVFIAHNGAAIFVNRVKDPKDPTKHLFTIRVNKGLHGTDGSITSWITVAEMEVEPLVLKDLLEKIGGLTK